MNKSIRNNPIIKAVLTPFSWLYGGITDIRNKSYDSGKQRSYNAPFKTISIGNITVGGTGKTPMTELLICLLKEKYRLGVISRGYGRKTKGVVVAEESSTAREIGDEPLQYYRKFGQEVNVIVGEKRADASKKMEAMFPDTELILLDDAYQHRAINRDINILLTDYTRPFFDDLPFPAGNLRERKKGADRADMIVVTKCPADLTTNQKNRIITSLHQYATQKPPVFFASVRYGETVSFTGKGTLKHFDRYAGVAGLAQNAPFESFLREHYDIREFKSFPDHHNYSKSVFQLIANPDKNRSALITTEKDMVKLYPIARELSLADNCFYIPIKVSMHERKEFESTILRMLNEV